MKSLFVPDSDNLQNRVASVNDKFAFVDSVKMTVGGLTDVITNNDGSPIFSINVMPNKWFSGSVNVVDLTWYALYKVYGDTVICCFAYAFFFWRIFINLSNIINGTGGAVDSYAQSQDIEAYRRFGFGRRRKM